MWYEIENLVALAYASGNRRALVKAFTPEWEKVLNDKHFVENLCEVALCKDWGRRYGYKPLPTEIVLLMKAHPGNSFISGAFFADHVQNALSISDPRVHPEDAATLALGMYHSSSAAEGDRCLEKRLLGLFSQPSFSEDEIKPQFMKLVKRLLETPVESLSLFSTN